MSTTAPTKAAMVIRGLPLHRAAGHLMDKYPGMDWYPTYNQIMRKAYDGRFQTEVEGRIRTIPDSDIARIRGMLRLRRVSQCCEGDCIKREADSYMESTP